VEVNLNFSCRWSNRDLRRQIANTIDCEEYRDRILAHIDCFERTATCVPVLPLVDGHSEFLPQRVNSVSAVGFLEIRLERDFSRLTERGVVRQKSKTDQHFG